MEHRLRLGAPVAQWVKRWPTDLAVPSSIPTRGEKKTKERKKNLLNRKRGSIAHSLSLSTSHRPDMTEILLKRSSIYASFTVDKVSA